MIYRPQNNEEGQGLVEYALILVLISVAVIVALQALAPQISAAFNTVSSSLNVTS